MKGRCESIEVSIGRAGAWQPRVANPRARSVMTKKSGFAYSRLGHHPCYSEQAGCLVCPMCFEDPVTADRVATMDRHLIIHELNQLEAKRWLSSQSYEALSMHRGWIDMCVGSGIRLVVAKGAQRPATASCQECGEAWLKVSSGKIAKHVDKRSSNLGS